MDVEEKDEIPQPMELDAFFGSDEPTSSPAKQDDVVTEAPKADEPAVETPKETPGEPAAESTEDEAKELGPSTNWDSDDNPYKKQVTDTRSWANELNKELLQLKKGQDILGKKMDGTYDPDAESAAEAISPEALVLQGKVAASEKLVRKSLGNEYVDKTLAEFDATFGQDRGIQARVLGSDAPVAEAIAIMQEREFQAKYGSDPESIRNAIRKEVEAELRTSIAKEESEKISKRLQRKEDQPTGLSEVRGSGSHDGGSKPSGPPPLAELFG